MIQFCAVMRVTMDVLLKRRFYQKVKYYYLKLGNDETVIFTNIVSEHSILFLNILFLNILFLNILFLNILFLNIPKRKVFQKSFLYRKFSCITSFNQGTISDFMLVHACCCIL